jgi:periplasmic protein TonB
MNLRCLLFSSDEGTSASIRQVLDDLGVDGESCPEAVTAVQQVTQQPYQFVIIDWDQQPEAGLVLAAARERKVSERPLTLAIVSHDHNVPKALQAGANSILRKPIVLNQAKDTLRTARDLLRARQESAAAAAAGATAKAQSPLPSATPASVVEENERSLRSAEFLPTSVAAPGGQFDTESDLQKSMEQSATEIDSLKELEPTAAAVTRGRTAPETAPAPDEPRGLQWYLNQRAAGAPKLAPIPPAAPTAPASNGPELMGYDQMAAEPAESDQRAEDSRHEFASEPVPDSVSATPSSREQKHEEQLFAYITGENAESEEAPRKLFRVDGGLIVAALALAACAVAAAPQAPWHARFAANFHHEQQSLHAWLNPQVVTPTQAPESHENFARAGDEYKLPVAENIPDATTDPTQIRVTPVVDPTVKKAPNAEASADQPATSTDATVVNPAAANPGQPEPGSDSQVQPSIQVQPTATESVPTAAPLGGENPAVAKPAAGTPSTAVPESHSEVPAAIAADTSAPQPASPQTLPGMTPQLVPQKSPQVQTVSTAATPPIPSSLKSQMATMAPEASGNKPPEAAMPSIEPVSIPEAAARALLTDQPAVAYPASAKGQQGTVILQVLIGRDGTVEDAKFLQGSLAFAKAAIDGARQWKFKPYMLNGRPVSIQTSLTMSFAPGS